MPWRYQPVFVEEDGERIYSLCEVYFDDAGNFERWTASAAMAPSGENVEELTNDLARMMTDAFAYKPVRFSDMKPGMIFEQRISMEERRNLADYIDETRDAIRRAPPPRTN